MIDFVNEEASSIDFINHSSTIPAAQRALETFSKFAAGRVVDYHKALFQLSNSCSQLEALQKQDEELLEELSASMEMNEEFKVAFDRLLVVLTGSTETIGQEAELLKSVLKPFTAAVEAFAGSELDPLATDSFTGQAYEGHTLSEPSREERLLREFLVQLTLLCRSTILLRQCRSALAVIQALLQKSPEPEKVKAAGAAYVYELAKLRALLMLEPMLTVMVGREQFRI